MWPLLLLAFTTSFSTSLVESFRSPALNSIKVALSLTHVQATWIFIIPSIAVFICALWITKNLSRLTPTTGLRWSLASLAISSMWLSQITNYWSMIFPLLLLGIGIAFNMIYQNVCVEQTIPPERRRSFFAAVYAIYGMGMISASIVGQWTYHWKGDWQDGFFWISLLPLGLLLTTWKLTSNKFSAETTKAPQEAYTKKLCLYVATITSFYFTAEMTMINRMSSYLETIKYFDAPTSHWWLMVFLIGLIASRLLVTLFPFPRLKTRHLIAASSFISLVGFFAGFYVHPIGFVIFGITFGPAYALMVNHIAELLPTNSSYAISYTMTAQSIFYIVACYVVGWISDYSTPEMAFLTIPSCLILAVICLIGLEKFKKLIQDTPISG